MTTASRRPLRRYVGARVRATCPRYTTPRGTTTRYYHLDREREWARVGQSQ